MQENFLHFIWQHQYFDKHDLVTTDEESLNVLATGQRNDHSGPDFSESRMKIGALEWFGFTEIHTKASEWTNHRHQDDPGYNNVVLHVVWKNDHPVLRQDGTTIPTLELKGRVDMELIDRYLRLEGTQQSIACSGQLATAERIVKISMLEKALFNRIESKAKAVFDLLTTTGNNWEEVAYRWIAQNFGFKVNNDAFASLAGILPYRILNRHRGNSIQIEALLFGQAGFLDGETKDDYHRQLAMEYQFLGKKYDLFSNQLHQHQWRFLRLRPPNFPTVRLAQLAQLLWSQNSIFSFFRDNDHFEGYEAALQGNVSSYWRYHFYFGKKHSNETKAMGKASVENLVINTAVPLLVAYGKQIDDHRYLEKAVKLLHSVKAESNRITKQWAALGMDCRSAFDSQAMIELYNSYCTHKKCLSCNIGAHLIKTA